MSNKNKTIAIIKEYLDGIDPSGFNTKFYTENIFSKDEKAFRKWMENLRDGKEHLVIYASEGSGVKLDFKRNLKFAKKKNISIYEALHYSKQGDVPSFTTPVEYITLPTMIRRQAQTWDKKNSTPPHMKSINPITEQPTGESQAAKMTQPEAQLISSSGLYYSLKEIMGPRGGDSGANAALTGMLVKTGKATLSAVRGFSTGAGATKYIKALFTAAHLKLGPL